MDALSLSFRYSEDDYVRAMRAHYKNRLRLPLDIVLISILVVLGAYLWNSGSQASATALFCVAGLFALMLIAAFLVIPRIVFRREPKFRDDYSLTFSRERIHFQTAHIDSWLDWAMYSRALIDHYSFVLYHGSSTFTVIPKRVFNTNAQMEAFENLLERKISVIIDRTKAKKK